MSELQIVFQDEWYVAIHKPPGLLVHRSRIADGDRFAMQMLRDQIGQWVYPVHRLDRPTSGVLVFALGSESARALVRLFENRQVEKRYLAVVRGYSETQGHIDYPLLEEDASERQQAVTDYRRLATVELPIAVGRYRTSRYSLLEVSPVTGRMRQIRKHMKHIFHPIVGDTSHGDGKHNQMFRERFNCHRLLLQAAGLRFVHPYTEKKISLRAGEDPELERIFKAFGWDGYL
ncbi:MAG: pseudouridine synthase [Sedimenticola sp.]